MIQKCEKIGYAHDRISWGQLLVKESYKIVVKNKLCLNHFFWAFLSNMHTNRIRFMFKTVFLAKYWTQRYALPIASQKIFVCTRDKLCNQISLCGPLWGVDYQFLELSIHLIRILLLCTLQNHNSENLVSSTKGMLKHHRFFRLSEKLKMYNFLCCHAKKM